MYPVEGTSTSERAAQRGVGPRTDATTFAEISAHGIGAPCDAALFDVLKAAGASIEQAASCEVSRRDGLVVTGGLGVRQFFDATHDAQGLAVLSPRIVQAIQDTNDAGKWIAAPCVALAIVLDALAEAVAHGDANTRLVKDGVVIFPDLRVIATDRPLLGKTEAERRVLLALVADELLNAVRESSKRRNPE